MGETMEEISELVVNHAVIRLVKIFRNFSVLKRFF